MIIKSYQDEIKSKRREKSVFWFVVFLFTAYLFTFFQGYNINFSLIQEYVYKISKVENLKRYLSSPTDTFKRAELLKPFGIIKIYTVPDPDSIIVDGKPYNNGAKVIYNLGYYDVNIIKKGYISVDLGIVLGKNNQFYSNIINLLKSTQYTRISEDFDEISNFDGIYLSRSKKDGKFKVFDENFKLKKLFVTDYNYIGYKYFSYNNFIYYYDVEKAVLKPIISRETGVYVSCSNFNLFNRSLFCYDNMKLLTDNNVNKKEKIQYINNNVIITEKYIYNNNPFTYSWNLYRIESSGAIRPDSLIHINNIPYLIENEKIISLQEDNQIIDETQTDQNQKIVSIIKNPIKIDEVKKVKEFSQDENLIFGIYENKKIMILTDYHQEYRFSLPEDFSFDELEIYKFNGYYVLKNKLGLFVYYRGGKDIIKIIEGNILMIDNGIIVFNKENKIYYLNLNEE
ncbi:MAG: hypothetical protein PHF46_01550 [Candidatus Gracilibacteria bacterium]|nr:hypothetical protein [Candidatus Gracilibacteria bacterium]MDD3120077.1 hypothetical protein [Candidatus Gracilibacteria bacterium]MDD4530285.1 hypothetical protein [Candidatus Gracilibacteria bacterium]